MRRPLSRREFLSTSVAAATAAAVGLPGFSLANVGAPRRRRCADGPGTRASAGSAASAAASRSPPSDKRVVAVRGDAASPVNRGLLCVKGYANAEIPYGADRLTHPLLRMKDGKFDKQGEFVPVSWQRAFDEMEREWRRAHAALGPTGVGIMGSGQYTIQEGYAASKLVKAGWRSNNLDPNARHCMASAVAAFMQTFGIDEPSGCYDDIEPTDTVVLWGANMAEMHPMLWARIVDQRLRRESYRGLQPDHLPQPLVGVRRRRDRLQAQHRPRDLELHRPRDRAARRRQPGVRRQALRLRRRPDRHRLRHAARRQVRLRRREGHPGARDGDRAVARGGDPGGPRPRTSRTASARRPTADPGKHWLIPFDEFKKALEPYTPRLRRRARPGRLPTSRTRRSGRSWCSSPTTTPTRSATW